MGLAARLRTRDKRGIRNPPTSDGPLASTYTGSCTAEKEYHCFMDAQVQSTVSHIACGEARKCHG